jgi:hypothetical protein
LPQLVEEVFKENHVVTRLLYPGGLGSHKRCDALAIRREIKIPE